MRHALSEPTPLVKTVIFHQLTARSIERKNEKEPANEHGGRRRDRQKSLNHTLNRRQIYTRSSGTQSIQEERLTPPRGARYRRILFLRASFDSERNLMQKIATRCASRWYERNLATELSPPFLSLSFFLTPRGHTHIYTHDLSRSLFPFFLPILSETFSLLLLLFLSYLCCCWNFQSFV